MPKECNYYEAKKRINIFRNNKKNISTYKSHGQFISKQYEDEVHPQTKEQSRFNIFKKQVDFNLA